MAENHNNKQSLYKKEKSRKEEGLRTAARGGGLGFIGMICSRALALFLQVAIARLCGIIFFGYYSTGIILILVLHVIAGMGLHFGGVRFMVQSMEHGDRRGMFTVYWTSVATPLLMGGFLALFLYVVSPALCTFVFKKPDMLPVLRIFSFAVPWYGLLRVLGELSRSFGTVRFTVLIEDILFPLLQICLLLSFFLTQNPLVVVVAYLSAAFICATILAIVVYSQIVRYRFDKSNSPAMQYSTPRIREILSYSIPLFPTGIIFMISINIDIFMLNMLSSAGVVGVYAAATRWTVLLDTLRMPISAIFRPLLARAISSCDMEMLRSLLLASSRWMLYIVLPFMACLFVASEPAMDLFLKEETHQAASVLLWLLILARLSNPIGDGAGNLLSIGGMQYKELVSLVLGTLLNILLNAIFIPIYGAIGAAIATGFGFLATNVLRIVFIGKEYNMLPLSRPMVLPIVALSLIIAMRIMSDTFLTGASYTIQVAIAGGAAGFVAFCCIYSFVQDPDDQGLARLLPNTIIKIVNRFLSPFNIMIQ